MCIRDRNIETSGFISGHESCRARNMAADERNRNAIKNINDIEHDEAMNKSDCKEKIINTDLNNDGLECTYAYKGFRTIFKKATVLSAVTLTLFACVMVGSSAWLTTYFTSFDVPIFLSSIFVSIYWFFTFVGLQLISKMLKYFKMCIRDRCISDGNDILSFVNDYRSLKHMQNIIGNIDKAFMNPVSYTHLDVYKRQLQ